jgi:hypothetical protein
VFHDCSPSSKPRRTSVSEAFPETGGVELIRKMEAFIARAFANFIAMKKDPSPIRQLAPRQVREKEEGLPR